MLHNEIAYGVYAALNSVLDVPLFTFSSNQTGERVVINIINNVDYHPFQKGELWLNIFTEKLNGLLNTQRMDVIKTTIEETLSDDITIPSGDLVFLNLKAVSTISDTPLTDQEAFISLVYEFRVIKTT